MPRAGGEADKLGNRYEGIWTIGRLLELAAAKSESLTVEPIGDEAIGIEFVVRHVDGTRECHSAKRQRTRGEWSLAVLTRKDKKTGRSILNDLFARLSTDGKHRCCFVSSTGANDFRELAERAHRRQTLSDFQDDLKSSDPLRQTFEKSVLPITSNDWGVAYEYLRRMQVVLIDEATLTRQVEQQIAYLVYRPDSREFSEVEVRVLLGDFIFDSLGTEIRDDAVWAFLSKFGYAKRDWATDTTIRDVVRERNRAYVRTVEFELINGARVPREETQTIVDEVRRGDGAKTVLASAAAGVGKSCVIAQAVDTLEAHDVPVLVVRMDRHGDAQYTQEIGIQMGLPGSPAVVLAGLASGRDSVLVVDQLDAVSQVSGRYPHLWEVFDSLCREAAAYPNMRLVIACRDFDLQHDHRLRKLKQPEVVKHVPVQLLSIEDVDTAIAAAGCVATGLNLRQKELLRTPLHLYLFLDGLGDDRSEVGFRDIGELLDRHWDRKQRAVSTRLGHEGAWTAVIHKLCDTMSRDLTVYVPAVIVDEWRDTAAAMLTEHVLVRDENQIRFFHESFFDYAFARRFCATGQGLIELLHSGEQHLFRRSQVRQILAFLRDHARSQYVAELRELLKDARVRFHIKRLVLAWLGTLTHPTSDEWAIVEPLLGDPHIQLHGLPPIRNSLPWFDVLHELRVVARWLESPDEEMMNRGLWFLMFDQVQKQRSETAAALLAPYCGRSPEWRNRLRAYFRFGNAHYSRAIQELLLRLLDNGTFEETSPDEHDSWWNRLGDAGEHAPLFALEAITHWLDQRIARASARLDESVLERQDHDLTAVQLIYEVAQREPAAYVEEMLPRVLTILSLSAIPSNDGLRLDKIWGFRSNHEPMYVSESVLDALVVALEKLATKSPDKVETVTVELLKTDWDTVTYVLLRAWSANPARFGSTCIQFLAADRRRLDVGYGSWGNGGNGHAAISREAIQACLPHVTTEDQAQLERAIIGFSPSGDEGEHEGWTERLLLEAFGEGNLSEAGGDRLAALRHKFPYQETAIPPRRSGGVRFVGSPIPPDETKEFSDEEWLAAMREYDYGWDDLARGGARVDRELRGSAVELSRVLQPQARLDRRRFAALTSQMDDSIRAEYFEAILDGICGLENLSTEDREADHKDFRRLETDVVLGVVRRLHRLPNHPCGRSICRAFQRLADRSISDADLEMLAYYALEDADPVSDHWLEEDSARKRDPSENAHFYGYNSVRGHAARAIEALLFADYSRSTVLVPLIGQMVRDPSIGVRTCVVEALLPMLNDNRDEAVGLFLETCRGAEIVFGSGPFEEFIRYASSTHYFELRDVLFKALRSTSPSAVAAAARQICLAAFTNLVAAGDAEAVQTGKASLRTAFRIILSEASYLRNVRLRHFLASLRLTIQSMRGFRTGSTETMRCAAAEVYSHYLGNATVTTMCRQQLCRLFADESEKVRATAAHCFVHLKNADFSEYTDIIRAYIKSPAFPSPHDNLLLRLEDSTWQLPDITIRLAQRFVAARGAAAGDISTAASRDARTVSKLVVRLYAQSGDETIRTKCLDLIDQMERLGFYGIDSQLAEHDR